LVDPAIAKHNGRIVKTTGDGLLVEFGSVVDAMRCAVEVQRGMKGRDAEIPTAMRIEFRVGINLGDIILDEGDIYGDGVNTAARLEALAEPGGICVSRVVRPVVGLGEDVEHRTALLGIVIEDAMQVAEGYSVCLIFLKLFERVYAPLTAARLRPVPGDAALPPRKHSLLDRLYQRFNAALDRLLHAVGLPPTPTSNENKILVHAPINA
jgi:hypothetical protein